MARPSDWGEGFRLSLLGNMERSGRLGAEGRVESGHLAPGEIRVGYGFMDSDRGILCRSRPDVSGSLTGGSYSTIGPSNFILFDVTHGQSTV
jgi:hypothetical protein